MIPRVVSITRITAQDKQTTQETHVIITMCNVPTEFSAIVPTNKVRNNTKIYGNILSLETEKIHINRINFALRN